MRTFEVFALLLLCLYSIDAPLSLSSSTVSREPTLWMIRYDYGSSSNQEIGWSVHEARDGGYLVGADVLWREGGPSTGLLRLDADGNIRWQKSYHRTYQDPFASLETTSNTGYVLATSGLEAVQTSPYTEYWALSIQKLDMDGNVDWQSVYGTTNDGPYRATVLETHDGGYLLAGGAMGWSFFVKLDTERHVQWAKEYVQAWDATLATDDGGYIALVTDIGGSSGRAALAKLDADGNAQWMRTYDRRVNLRSMQKTRDGGFILAGYITVGCSTCQDALKWQTDLSVLKVDSKGEIQWQRAYGGPRYDAATKVLQTSDGGYAVLGYTDSSYLEINGDGEVWLIKLDGNGNMQWQRTYGRQSTSDIRYEEKPFSIQQTNDGGYVVAGLACSQGSAAPYGCDVLVLRLDAEGSIPKCPLMGSAKLATDVANITTASGTLESWPPENLFKSLSSEPARTSETNATANVECSYTPSHGIEMTTPVMIVLACVGIAGATISLVIIKRRVVVKSST
jgi:hypothetical protein